MQIELRAKKCQKYSYELVGPRIDAKMRPASRHFESRYRKSSAKNIAQKIYRQKIAEIATNEEEEG
ncbi:hypothetical protein GCM10009000_074560 [Halobacterium noricense]|uniref:Uncharacterized protein n=1 Tax=Haladaptatus pallidirubidus TaxID=1008152 RepID=A0AAV3ULT2_9EURY